MGSTRLPGKVLARAGGATVLDLLLERLLRCDAVDGIVVATSREPADDAIAAWCARRGAACHRGPLLDVAARLLDAARGADADALVRVCADSPLLDPALVDRAARLYRAGAADLVTNVRPRRFPRGQSVEVVACALLAQALPAMDAREREHVTPLLYRSVRPERLRRIEHPFDQSGVRLVVDTPEDLDALRRLLRRMDRPQWQYGLDELLALRQPRPAAAAGRCAPA